MRLARDSFSVEAAISKGRALPQWYTDEPPLSPLAPIIFKAFRCLDTCRLYENGPIPWSSIVEYGLTNGWERVNLDILCAIIFELDKAYLTQIHESRVRQQKQMEQQSASAAGKTRRAKR